MKGGVSKAELGVLVDLGVDLSILPGVLLGKLILEKSDRSWGSVSSGLEFERQGKVPLVEQSNRLSSGIVCPSLVIVLGVECSSDNWSLVRKSSDFLHVTKGVFWSVSSSEQKQMSVSLVNIIALWEYNSLLSVVSDSLETNQLERETLELGFSAWQPG